MKPEDAALLAAGLGIAGTLGGALGGALVQSRSALRQTRAQEAVDVRHRLRDERKAAYTVFLDRYDDMNSIAYRVLEVRGSSDWLNDDNQELRVSLGTVSQTLEQAVREVEITGPPHMAVNASLISDAAEKMVQALLADHMDLDGGTEASRELDNARARFVEGAQAVLAPPEGL